MAKEHTLVAAETCLASSQSLWVYSGVKVAVKCMGSLEMCTGCSKCVCIAFASGFFQDTCPQKRWELDSRKMMVLICFATSKLSSYTLLIFSLCCILYSTMQCLHRLCFSSEIWKHVLGYVFVIFCHHEKDQCRKEFLSQ